VADVVELTARLNELQKARALGVLRLSYGDRAVEYRSDAEMAAAIADVMRQITLLSGVPLTGIRIAASKGLA
jgi:hypothetical protein